MSQDGWYFGSRGTQPRGPVSLAELQGLAARGELSGDDLVWCAGMAEWAEARTVPGILPEALPRVAGRRRPVAWIVVVGLAVAMMAGAAFLWQRLKAPPIGTLVELVPRSSQLVAIARGLPQIAVELGAVPGGSAAGPVYAALAKAGEGLGLDLGSQSSVLATGLDITEPIGLSQQAMGEGTLELAFLPVANVGKMEATLASVAGRKGWTSEPAASGEDAVFAMQGGKFFYTFYRDYLILAQNVAPEAAAVLGQLRRGELGSVGEAPWFEAMRAFRAESWHVLLLADPAWAGSSSGGSTGERLAKLAGLGGRLEISSKAIRGRFLELSAKGTEHDLYAFRGDREDRFATRVGGPGLGLLRLSVDVGKWFSEPDQPNRNLGETFESFGDRSQLDVSRDLVPYLGAPLSVAVLRAEADGTELPWGLAAWLPLKPGHRLVELLAQSLGRAALEEGGATWYPLFDESLGARWAVVDDHLVLLWQISPAKALASGSNPSILDSVRRGAARDLVRSSHDAVFYLNVAETFQEGDVPPDAKVFLEGISDLVFWADFEEHRLEGELALFPASEEGFGRWIASLVDEGG